MGFSGADLRLKFIEHLLGTEEDMLEVTVRFLGRTFLCSRVYIFEMNYANSTFDNTYEWCADGVEPQISVLKGEPIGILQPFFDNFEHGKPIVIDDIENIKDEMPTIYTALKPQDIKSLVIAALKIKGEVIGFIGLDNPQQEDVGAIIEFFDLVTPAITLMTKGTNDLRKLERAIKFDEMTGAYSAGALDMLLKTVCEPASVGVFFCDVVNVRKINEDSGRSAGDEAIQDCYKLVKSVFPNDDTYRVNGDSFATILIDRGSEYLENNLTKLKTLALNHRNHISFGSSYSDGSPVNLRALLQQAESRMLADKEAYYNSMISYSDKLDLLEKHKKELCENGVDMAGGDFEKYIKNNFFNPELLVKSMAAADGSIFVYFGDLQTNIFYISDNMRDTFGFESNLVENMMAQWTDRIANSGDRQLYIDDIDGLLSEKRGVHDLRYRVKDKFGNQIWIHCRGEILWTPDKSKPLFFSGCLIKQEYEFVVDPITNFMREAAAIRRLTTFADSAKRTVIGFSLNSFSDINELLGKEGGDELLKDIAKRLAEDFEGRVYFYRLDGLRFAAILNEGCTENPETVISRMRQLINLRYRHHGASVSTPCSMAVLSVGADEMTPREMISNIILLLNVAKNSRDKDYVVYSTNSVKEQHVQAEMIFELTRNVQNDFENFRIVVQPTVSAKDERVVSGEVLLRWTFKGENVPPSVFVPLLEKHRLIYAVGKWLFEQVVKTAVRVHTIAPNITTAFNVSYLQVLDSDFFPHMKSVLSNYKLDAGKLILELTETNFDESPQKLSDFFNSCVHLGLQVALDDFGSGYSSLGMLLKYPTDIVKLDKSLLNEMSTSEDKQKFINSIVYACHMFGKTVCAEGVETQTELELMRSAECDSIQGYYYSKPLELVDYYKFVFDNLKK